MRSVTLLLLGICISFVFSAEITREEGVLVLTEDNFQQALAENRFLLVEFYAPWCGHCKKLAPEYARAAQALAADNINIGKVDATVQKELGKKYDVSGYPTLKFFVDGNPSEYNGGRTEPEIVSWIRKKTGPPSKEFSAPADVESWSSSREACAVFFGTNADLFSIYESVARSSEDLEFAHCSSDECLSHFSAKHGQVTVFKKFDDKRNDMTESFTESSLTSWLNSNSSPKVMKFDEKCAQVIFGKATPGIFFYRDPNSSNASHIQELATALAEKVSVNYLITI